MDENLLLGTVLRGLFGARRKRAGRALRYMMGGRGGGFFSNPATLMTAAGLAWGVYDTLTQSASAPAPADGPAAPAVVPPPIPGTEPAAATPSDDVVRMVRLAISAAYADGSISEHERAAILKQAQDAGAAAIVERELQHPRPLKEVVAGVTDPAQRATLYVLAFTILRADEQLTGAERIYLAQLANLLGLDAQTVAALEKDTGERIDALGDQGQPGG
jgi:uncharacterized membrane protein YebE (DUF533 family)